MDTPLWQIDKAILTRNILAMAKEAKKAGVSLRPHFKTHKILEIAHMQMKAGAIGLTTAKLGEAEVLVDGGIDDVLIAYPLWGEEKWCRLVSLAQRARIATVVDDPTHIEWLSSQCTAEGIRLPLYLEIDTGLKRCGVEPREALALAQRIQGLGGLELRGLLTHAGHAYGVSSHEEVAAIGLAEAKTLVELKETFEAHGIAVPVLSAGSTPTVRYNLQVPGITEVRPGNYVFYDGTQVHLGVCSWEDCALRVKVRVVSHPKADRWVIDGGSKTFALDQGAHGQRGMVGYGRIMEYPHLTISRLSEEHGIVEGQGRGPKIGEILTVIPNHACPSINLTDRVEVLDRWGATEVWEVKGRGRVQ